LPTVDATVPVGITSARRPEGRREMCLRDANPLQIGLEPERLLKRRPRWADPAAGQMHPAEQRMDLGVGGVAGNREQQRRQGRLHAVEGERGLTEAREAGRAIGCQFGDALGGCVGASGVARGELGPARGNKGIYVIKIGWGVPGRHHVHQSRYVAAAATTLCRQSVVEPQSTHPRDDGQALIS